MLLKNIIMTRESIKNLINKRVETSLGEGLDIDTIISVLNDRIIKFISIIKKDSLYDVNRLLVCSDPDSITPTRIRYLVFYVNESNKCINELNWMIANKNRFPNLNNYKLFKLLLLKDKLSIM